MLHSTRRFACPQASIGRFGPVASIRWPEPIAGTHQIAPEAGQTAPMPVASVRIRPGSPAAPQAGGLRQGSPVAGGRIPGPVAAAYRPGSPVAGTQRGGGAPEARGV